MKPIINRFWSESICGISSCPWLSHDYLVWEKYDLSNDGTSIDNRNEILLRISSNLFNNYEVQIQFIYSKRIFHKNNFWNPGKYVTSKTRLVEAWILFLNFWACWEFQCLPWTFAAVFPCLRTFQFLSIFLNEMVYTIHRILITALNFQIWKKLPFSKNSAEDIFNM